MRAFLWFTFAVCTAGCVPLLPAQSTTDTVYHLHGTVVNGVTGRPIGRALVVSADRRLATMTNTEGQFHLDVSVPPTAAANTGQGTAAANLSTYAVVMQPALALLAQRPGYLPSRQGVRVSLDGNTGTQNITLRLLPSASIRGQVSANGAEGLRGLRVQLLRRSAQDGRLSWRMVATRAVGEDGTFRMADLQPGDYTVATSEWSPGIFRSISAPAPSEQYPPVFLGGTRTLDGATRLHLTYGQSAEAQLRVQAVPYFPVTIPIQGLPPNAGANVRVAAGVGFQLFQLGWNNRDGAVEGSLPSGDYLVIVNTFGAQRSGAQIPLHVAGGPVTHAPVGLTPTEDVAISVRDERTQGGNHASTNISLTMQDGSSTAMSTPGFFLTARPEDPESGGGSFMQNTADGPVLRGMMPGRYFLQGAAMGNGYIASVTCDGVNLLTQPLVVNDSGHTAPVEVTLRDDGGTVSGTVNLGDSGLQTARVLLIPTDGSGQVRYSYVNNAGAFQITNVPPGSYRAFATPADQSDTLPYLDAQAMRPYAGKGGAVNVMAGQTAQVQAELVDVDGAEVQR